jgi:two-component system, NarL family, sensor histidine kinase UhpB
MTLRFRLAIALLSSFILAILLGGALIILRADRSVATEMDAALASNIEMVNDRLASPQARSPSSLLKLVADFNGQRHVRASLQYQDRLISSRLAEPVDLPPPWFMTLIDVKPVSQRMEAASPWTLSLQTDPRNEIGEVWGQARDAFLAIVGLCCLIAGLVYLFVIRALRTLGEITQALSQVAAGNCQVAVSENLVTDMVPLAHGFNQMAAQLSRYSDDNRHLQQQILRFQEEERAEIARDLHDDVGPFLFSIGVDAQSIMRLVSSGRTDGVLDRTARICDSVAHIQGQVRALLRQLRPNDRLDLGIEAALDDLVSFWRLRHPELHFDLNIAPSGVNLDREITEVAYRTIQESVSNAVRHGHPQRVQISLASARENLRVQVVNDGRAADLSDSGRGMGVSLMTERVKKMGGSLKIENGSYGVSVVATIPREKGALFQ